MKNYIIPIILLSVIIGLSALLLTTCISNNTYKQREKSLLSLLMLLSKPKSESNKTYTLDGTGYHDNFKECGNKKHITRGGFLINSKNPLKQHLCGLPRYMLKEYDDNAEFDFGDSVIVEGKSNFPYSGTWCVADCTNANIYGRIDFLIGFKDFNNLWKNLKIRKK